MRRTPRLAVGGMAGSRLGIAALVVTLVVQLVVLYDPSPSGVPAFPGLDKIVHVTVFLLPTLVGVMTMRTRPWLLPTLMAAHAPLSELAQATFLPERSGDPMDALADVVGVAAGTVVGLVWVRTGRRRQADTLG